MEPMLDPAEFTGSAARAVAACAGLPLQDQARRLAEDGLLGILAPEAAGGLGLGLAYAAPVIEAASAGLLDFPLLETLLLCRALPPEVAGPLVAGTRVATIAWSGTMEGGMLGRAPFLSQADLVLARGTGGGALLPVEAARLTEVPGLDADRPTVEMLVPAALPALDVDWAALESDALLLRAAAMLGAAAAALALAQAHVATRKQFGRPLVAFQAIRHSLARQKLAVEGMRGLLQRGLAEGNQADPFIRRTAFAFAATHAPLVAEAALQLHGGMGYTWDIAVHRHLRHIRQWEAEGQAAQVRAAIARRLIEDAPDYDWGSAA